MSTPPQPDTPPERSAAISLDELKQSFSEAWAKWRGKQMRADLEAIFQREENAKTTGSIKSIICVGLGSPSGTYDRDNSLWQLVFFLNLPYLLRGQEPPEKYGEDESPPPEMPAYLQDPAFNDVDKEFFKNLRVEIVHMKAKDNAWTKIKADSLLFAPTFLLRDAPAGLFFTAEAHARVTKKAREDSERAFEEATRMEGEPVDRPRKEDVAGEGDSDLSSGEWLPGPGIGGSGIGDQSMLPFNPADRPAVNICRESQIRDMGKDGTPLLTDYKSVDFPQNDGWVFWNYVMYIRKET